MKLKDYIKRLQALEDNYPDVNVGYFTTQDVTPKILEVERGPTAGYFNDIYDIFEEEDLLSKGNKVNVICLNY